MKYFNILITIFIILSFSSIAQSIIRSIHFLSGSNLLTSDDVQRDGIVIATLDTNENTTICNFNFDEISAGVVCRTLGFPAQGMSIIDNRNIYGGPVLLANVQCTGTEANLGLCVTSGRSVQTGVCATHTTDVHVLCTQQKVGPVVVPNPVVTTCNVPRNDYFLSGTRVNSGLLQASFSGSLYYVCNDDYSFQQDYARIICNMMCTNSTFPHIIMPYFNESLQRINTFTSVRVTCNSATCIPSSPIECFKKSFLIGLQCGEEPKVIEQSPNVTCTTKNMTVTWNTGFLPPILPSYVSLATNPGCANATGDSSIAANLTINFDSCPPNVNGDQNNIYFSYLLNRMYASDGLVTIPPKTLTVTCIFPKSGQNTDGFLVNGVTNSPINTSISLERRMEFYRDTSYSSQIIPPSMVDSDKKVYVKVYVVNPTKNISLALSDCWATTSPNSTSFDTSNSVSLIGSSCPNLNYDVVISPFSRTEIRFSFTPFKITSNATQQFYVACSTFICFLNRDSYCPFCGSRKRRSVNVKNVNEFFIKKSIYLRRPSKKIFDLSD